MTRKIFRSILLVAGVVLAAGMVIMTGCLYSYFGGVQEQQLQDELSLAVSGVENGGTAYLERLPAERFRLTWIASDGRVLYDTQVTDVAPWRTTPAVRRCRRRWKTAAAKVAATLIPFCSRPCTWLAA